MYARHRVELPTRGCYDIHFLDDFRYARLKVAPYQRPGSIGFWRDARTA